jgi:iron complex outermembrane recepter protein
MDPSAPQLGVLDLTGNRLTQAPELAGNLGAQYQFLLASRMITLRGEANYSARVFYTPFNNPAVSTPAYAKANAFLTYDSDDKHWSGSLFLLAKSPQRLCAYIGRQEWADLTGG